MQAGRRKFRAISPSDFANPTGATVKPARARTGGLIWPEEMEIVLVIRRTRLCIAAFRRGPVRDRSRWKARVKVSDLEA